MSETLGTGLVIVAVSAVLLMLYILGYSSGSGTVQQDAVRQGAAEWIVIDEQGNTEFRWKTKAACP